MRKIRIANNVELLKLGLRDVLNLWIGCPQSVTKLGIKPCENKALARFNVKYFNI